MNPSPLETNDPAYLDVREIPCRDKHALIFRRWGELAVGCSFVLVNDHDPVPLYYQFAAQFPEAFTWEYLANGPDEVQVRITRTAANPAAAVRVPAGGCGEARAAMAAMLDLRGFEPPEPMRRILQELEALPAGGEFQAITDRKPVPLLAELDQRGIEHSSHPFPDGGWINTFRR